MRRANLDDVRLHPVFIRGVMGDEALPLPVLLMYICIVNYFIYSSLLISTEC